MLNKIALKRLNLITYKGKIQQESILGATLNAEIGQLGFRIKNYQEIDNISSKSLKVIINTLKEMRGANVNYVPLFSKFPDEIPNQWFYLIKRLFSYFNLYEFSEAEKKDFGADPTTQYQSLELYEEALAKQKEKMGDTHIEWIELTALPIELVKLRLVEWVLALIYGLTPIQETLWDDIFYCLNQLNIPFDLNQVTIKETLVRVVAKYWTEANSLQGLKTPTDLLRLFAFLTDQDVSLAENISFKGLKYSKPQRRTILQFLENCSNLEEDLLRYQGLWKKILKGLHPGDYKDKFPRVVKAYNQLLNGEILSFESQLQKAQGDAKLALLKQRPSILIRKLSNLIGEVSPDSLVTTLQELNPEDLPLPLLMQAFFGLNYKSKRLVINKQGKLYNIPTTSFLNSPLAPVTLEEEIEVPNLVAFSQFLKTKIPKLNISKPSKIVITQTLETEKRVSSQLLSINKALDNLIIQKLANLWDINTKVWIDPRLFSYILPLQARKQSEGLLNLARGTHIKLGNQKVLRSFVYWKQQKERTDYDLALMKLDDNFNYTGRVSWSSYSSEEDIIFSGDIQSAEIGACEFLDIKLDAVKQTNPYLVVSVLVFAGENFEQITACYSGWMMRDNPENDVATFDAKTVANKVTVKSTSQARFWVPFIIDTRKRELIYVDLYSKGSNAIEGNKHLPATVAALVKYNQYRPNFGALAHWFKRANKSQLTPKEKAEITIGMDDDCTINVTQLMGDRIFTLGLTNH